MHMAGSEEYGSVCMSGTLQDAISALSKILLSLAEKISDLDLVFETGKDLNER